MDKSKEEFGTLEWLDDHGTIICDCCSNQVVISPDGGRYTCLACKTFSTKPMKYKVMQKIREMSPNMLVSEYLKHCCLYYELAVEDIDDTEFDYLAKRLAQEYEHAIHPNKSLIKLEELKKSSSGRYLTYPSITRSCACHTAARIPGGPMYGKSVLQLNEYVLRMMPKLVKA